MGLWHFLIALAAVLIIMAKGLSSHVAPLQAIWNILNFAAVIIVGLGCEANQLKPLLQSKNAEYASKIKSLVMQEEGGTQKTIDKAIALVEEILPEANQISREPLSLSHLCVALQCGGSDGYSGITANPALGVAVDHLVAHGGTAILSETPEIYGAEHLLTRRAVNTEVGHKLVDLIHSWEAYADREKGSIDTTTLHRVIRPVD